MQLQRSASARRREADSAVRSTQLRAAPAWPAPPARSPLRPCIWPSGESPLSLDSGCLVSTLHNAAGWPCNAAAASHSQRLQTRLVCWLTQSLSVRNAYRLLHRTVETEKSALDVVKVQVAGKDEQAKSPDAVHPSHHYAPQRREAHSMAAAAAKSGEKFFNRLGTCLLHRPWHQVVTLGRPPHADTLHRLPHQLPYIL